MTSPRLCEVCDGPLPDNSRATALVCGAKCRQRKHAAAQLAWAARNRDKKNASSRASRDRLKVDPEWRANRDRASRKWREANPERHKLARRRAMYKQKYGISYEDFLSTLESQGGRCAICGCSEPGTKGFCIDHNHKTGEVRGVLCPRCNAGLGFFQESTAAMAQAVAYLEMYS